jgi:hypothetical protein
MIWALIVLLVLVLAGIFVHLLMRRPLIPLLKATTSTPDSKLYKVWFTEIHPDTKPVEYIRLILSFAAKMLYIISPNDRRQERAKQALLVGLRVVGHSQLSSTSDIAALCGQGICVTNEPPSPGDKKITATLFYTNPVFRSIKTSIPARWFELQFFHSWLALVQQSLPKLDDMHLRRLRQSVRRLEELYSEGGVDLASVEGLVSAPTRAFVEAHDCSAEEVE